MVIYNYLHYSKAVRSDEFYIQGLIFFAVLILQKGGEARVTYMVLLNQRK